MFRYKFVYFPSLSCWKYLLFGAFFVLKQSFGTNRIRTFAVSWLDLYFPAKGILSNAPPPAPQEHQALTAFHAHPSLWRLFLSVAVPSDGTAFKWTVGWKAGFMVWRLRPVQWAAVFVWAKDRGGGSAPLPSEENNNDSGHNQLHTDVVL